MREQLLLLIRISKPEYNKCLYDEYKLYMNPQMSFNKVGLTDGQYDKYEGAITDIPCKILYSTDEKKTWHLLGDANKMLKSLEEDKAFWVNKEATSSTYVAAINEEPVVPEYDYTEVAATITSLDEKIAIIKHALNVTNSNEKVQVGDAEMSIDTILIKMAQLNKRKSVLDQMRKQLPKAREEQRSYMSRNTVPEYRYINYDLELIKKEYEAVSKTIMEMQMALDKYNQTVQFEVDI